VLADLLVKVLADLLADFCDYLLQFAPKCDIQGLFFYRERADFA
jgi:hypothetical protein